MDTPKIIDFQKEREIQEIVKLLRVLSEPAIYEVLEILEKHLEVHSTTPSPFESA